MKEAAVPAQSTQNSPALVPPNQSKAKPAAKKARIRAKPLLK